MMKKNCLNGITKFILPSEFYQTNAVELAQNLIGKIIVRKYENNICKFFIITETEAYMGEEDKACHCSKGKTNRTKVMYESGGKIYVYLIYGMYWMLNIVSGKKDSPEAVLIRGIAEISKENGKLLNIYNGPGKTGRILKINKTDFNEKKIYNISTKMSIISNLFNHKVKITSATRIGINYAGEPWISKKWRFIGNFT